MPEFVKETRSCAQKIFLLENKQTWPQQCCPYTLPFLAGAILEYRNERGGKILLSEFLFPFLYRCSEIKERLCERFLIVLSKASMCSHILFHLCEHF